MATVIGVTIGDPGGIGPEIVLKALNNVKEHAEFIIFGSRRVLQWHAKHFDLPVKFKNVEFVDVDNVADPFFGPRPEISGKASIEYLNEAFRYYEVGKFDALVTGPIHKESWHAAGHFYPGQTEFCAERTNTAEYCMLMASDSFRIALLSTHLSLQKAILLIHRQRIVAMIRLLSREFQKLGYENPHFAIAAVNPHAGEAGAFGTEEQHEIEPALDEVRQEGIQIDGPIAPEVIFRVAAREKRWDAILAMYHDQAMIPLKLIDFDRSANVTLGLPLIRTSPDHGTAFDIAGKGKANPGSMEYAIHLARDWTMKRVR